MQQQNIPEIEIIDLEEGSISDDAGTGGAVADNGVTDDNGVDDGVTDDNGVDNGMYDTDADYADTQEPPRKKKLPINIHIVLLAVVVLTFGLIFYKYMTWGQIVERDDDSTDPDDYTAESYDNILALTDENGNIIAPDLEDGLTIAILGNGPFAEDRNSEDGLANMLAEATGATVYNCAISGSYLASTEPNVPDMYGNPWDAFNFYWMSFYTTDVEVHDFFGVALELMGADVPPEAPEVYEILSTLDFDTVDIIVVMYDATDYFAGRPACSTEDISVIQSFAGNLESGLKVLQEHHPNTRIIVMSPTYAFSDRLDENGDYISSDIVRYGQDVLSDYISKAAESCAATQVTFVDNFYVTFNEDNALNYLSDNLHMNAAGRKKVIERLIYALNYFNDFYE